jgi:fatty acid desaturase
VEQAKAHCRRFAVADNRDAVREVSVTLALYATGIVIFPVLTNSFLWYAGVIFCGLVNARTIVIFHDCNHGKLWEA